MRIYFIQSLRAWIARRYLEQCCAQHARQFDQQVVFSFDWISQSIALDGRYEREELECLRAIVGPLVAGRTVLDVGANIGNHTRVFSEWAQQVFAFEPNPRTFAVLRLNTGELPNVVALNLGASDTSAVVSAQVPQNNAGGASIIAKGSAMDVGMRCVEFRVVPLDSLLELTGISVGFIKIDVEGHELPALRGMQQVLATHSPVIAFEQNAMAGGGAGDVAGYLRQVGYSYFYELSDSHDWRVPQALPAWLRRPLRLLESLLLGVPVRQVRARPITTVENRRYILVLAAKSPLRV